MATKKPLPAAKPKKKGTVAGEMLDGVGWVVREAALPIPDTLLKLLKKKKKR
jgi:hypothetical protein